MRLTAGPRVWPQRLGNEASAGARLSERPMARSRRRATFGASGMRRRRKGPRCCTGQRARGRPGGWPATGGTDARSTPWSPGPRRATGETDPPIACRRVPVHRASAAADSAALPAADASLVAMGGWAGAPLETLPGFAPGASTVFERPVTSRLGPRRVDMHPDRPTRLLGTGPTPQRPRPVSAVDRRIPHVTWIYPPRREVLRS